MAKNPDIGAIGLPSGLTVWKMNIKYITESSIHTILFDLVMIRNFMEKWENIGMISMICFVNIYSIILDIQKLVVDLKSL